MKRFVKVQYENKITDTVYPIWCETTAKTYVRYEVRYHHLICISTGKAGNDLHEEDMGIILKQQDHKPWFVKPWRIL